MKTSTELTDLLDEVTNEVELTLISLIENSNTESKHISGYNAIDINLFGYTEMVYYDFNLIFLDCNGNHYSLMADATLEDLIEIISENESQ